MKSLERHTLRAHGDPKVFPPREKGVLSLMEFAQKKKKQKVSREQEKVDEAPVDSCADETSLLARISQISAAVATLFGLVNPFRNAVSSLEQSTKKLEKLLDEKMKFALTKSKRTLIMKHLVENTNQKAWSFVPCKVSFMAFVCSARSTLQRLKQPRALNLNG